MIGDGTKNFRKYQLAIWLSIQNFYSHFTKVTRKCECFGRNIEACRSKSKFWMALNQDNVSDWSGMSRWQLLFQWVLKNPTPHVNLVQSGHQHPIGMWLFITMVCMKNCSLGSKELLCTHPLSSISIIVYQICEKIHFIIGYFKNPLWNLCAKM